MPKLPAISKHTRTVFFIQLVDFALELFTLAAALFFADESLTHWKEHHTLHVIYLTAAITFGSIYAAAVTPRITGKP